MMFASRQGKAFFARLKGFLWPKGGMTRSWRYIVHRLARLKVSPDKIALGFAAGAFASFTPFIGLHFIIAAILAALLRANLLASAIGTAIGNPLTFPFIWFVSYNLGAFILGKPAIENIDISHVTKTASITDGPLDFVSGLWHGIAPFFWPVFIGGIPLGLLCAGVSYVAIKTAIVKCKQARNRRMAA